MSYATLAAEVYGRAPVSILDGDDLSEAHARKASMGVSLLRDFDEAVEAVAMMEDGGCVVIGTTRAAVVKPNQPVTLCHLPDALHEAKLSDEEKAEKAGKKRRGAAAKYVRDEIIRLINKVTVSGGMYASKASVLHIYPHASSPHGIKVEFIDVEKEDGTKYTGAEMRRMLHPDAAYYIATLTSGMYGSAANEFVKEVSRGLFKNPKMAEKYFKLLGHPDPKQAAENARESSNEGHDMPALHETWSRQHYFAVSSALTAAKVPQRDILAVAHKLASDFADDNPDFSEDKFVLNIKKLLNDWENTGKNVKLTAKMFRAVADAIAKSDIPAANKKKLAVKFADYVENNGGSSLKREMFLSAAVKESEEEPYYAQVSEQEQQAMLKSAVDSWVQYAVMEKGLDGVTQELVEGYENAKTVAQAMVYAEALAEHVEDVQGLRDAKQEALDEAKRKKLAPGLEYVDGEPTLAAKSMPRTLPPLAKWEKQGKKEHKNLTYRTTISTDTSYHYDMQGLGGTYVLRQRYDRDSAYNVQFMPKDLRKFPITGGSAGSNVGEASSIKAAFKIAQDHYKRHVYKPTPRFSESIDENEDDPVVVVFRKFKDDGRVIALFPYELADRKGNITSYARVGQHSAASPDLLFSGDTDFASPAEYASLKRELENRGYVLNVRNSVPRNEVRRFISRRLADMRRKNESIDESRQTFTTVTTQDTSHGSPSADLPAGTRVTVAPASNLPASSDIKWWVQKIHDPALTKGRLKSHLDGAGIGLENSDVKVTSAMKAALKESIDESEVSAKEHDYAKQLENTMRAMKREFDTFDLKSLRRAEKDIYPQIERITSSVRKEYDLEDRIETIYKLRKMVNRVRTSIKNPTPKVNNRLLILTKVLNGYSSLVSKMDESEDDTLSEMRTNVVNHVRDSIFRYMKRESKAGEEAGVIVQVYRDPKSPSGVNVVFHPGVDDIPQGDRRPGQATTSVDIGPDMSGSDLQAELRSAMQQLTRSSAFRSLTEAECRMKGRDRKDLWKHEKPIVSEATAFSHAWSLFWSGNFAEGIEIDPAEFTITAGDTLSEDEPPHYYVEFDGEAAMDAFIAQLESGQLVENIAMSRDDLRVGFTPSTASASTAATLAALLEQFGGKPFDHADTFLIESDDDDDYEDDDEDDDGDDEPPKRRKRKHDDDDDEDEYDDDDESFATLADLDEIAESSLSGIDEANNPAKVQKIMQDLNDIAQDYGWKVENGALFNRSGTKVHDITIKKGRGRLETDGDLRGSFGAGDLTGLNNVLEKRYYARKVNEGIDESDLTPMLRKLEMPHLGRLKNLRHEYRQQGIERLDFGSDGKKLKQNLYDLVDDVGGGQWKDGQWNTATVKDRRKLAGNAMIACAAIVRADNLSKTDKMDKGDLKLLMSLWKALGDYGKALDVHIRSMRESVDESGASKAGITIMNQLGNQAMFMMGVKKSPPPVVGMIDGAPGVRMRIGRNSTSGNALQITVNGNDYYDITLMRIAKNGSKTIEKKTDVPVERMHAVIQKMTGLRLSMTKTYDESIDESKGVAEYVLKKVQDFLTNTKFDGDEDITVQVWKGGSGNYPVSVKIYRDTQDVPQGKEKPGQVEVMLPIHDNMTSAQIRSYMQRFKKHLYSSKAFKALTESADDTLSPDMDALLDGLDDAKITEASISRLVRHMSMADGFVILSADRKERTKPENKAAQQRMKSAIRSAGYGFNLVDGMGPEQDPITGKTYMAAEQSFFIPKVATLKEAQAIARIATREPFSQTSILWGAKGEGVWLIYGDMKKEKIGTTLSLSNIGDYYTQWRKHRFAFHDDGPIKVESFRLVYQPKNDNDREEWADTLRQLAEDDVSERDLTGDVKGMKKIRDKAEQLLSNLTKIVDKPAHIPARVYAGSGEADVKFFIGQDRVPKSEKTGEGFTGRVYVRPRMSKRDIQDEIDQLMLSVTGNRSGYESVWVEVPKDALDDFLEDAAQAGVPADAKVEERDEAYRVMVSQDSYPLLNGNYKIAS